MIDSKAPPASGEFNLLGDMTILREIIMGPQIMSNNSRFSEMQADLTKKNDEFEKRLSTVEKSFEAQLKKMESSFQQQLTELRENTEKTRFNDSESLAKAVSALSNAIKIVQ